MERTLIVSIHDVAPPFAGEVGRILDQLKKVGICRCSLLVVPDYHQTGPIDRDGEWTGRLRRWAAEGHEIVLHGYHHRAGSSGSGARGFFFRRLYTNSECEFLDLSEQQAAGRLKEGLQVLERAGLRARGFVAPAWLLSGGSLEALKKLGFDYTNTLQKIIDLKTGRVSDGWSQVYSSRAFWRRWTSVAWNEALFFRNRRQDCVRISIHPPEVRYPVLWRHLESLLVRAQKGRKIATYVDFVDRQRLQAT